MITLKNFATIIAVAILTTVIANAQSGNDTLKHFEKDNVSFDYPAAWKLNDSSADDVLYITMATEGSSVQIAVIVQPDPGVSCASESRRRNITSALVDRVAVQIHAVVPV